MLTSPKFIAVNSPLENKYKDSKGKHVLQGLRRWTTCRLPTSIERLQTAYLN